MGCSSCNSNSQLTSSVYNRSKTNKNIKFSCSSTGANLSVLEGSRAKAKMDICDLSFLYEQFYHTTLYLEPETTSREISHSLGNKITFVAFKVTYTEVNVSSCCSSNEANTISYIFESSPSEERHIKDFMLLTGSEENSIPKIFLSNPDTKHAATVEVILATTNLVYGQDTYPAPLDKSVTITNLTIDDISSDSDFIYVNDFNIRWIDITNIDILELERNGKILTLDDYVQGIINLSFQSQYMADQVYSLLLWAFNDTQNNIISDNQPDIESPTIIRTSDFTLSIPLDNFPPLIDLDGTNFIHDIAYEGTNGSNIIYRSDLFKYLVSDITDNRDMMIYDDNILHIRGLESTSYVDIIVSVGKYFIEFEITDNANNTLYESYILDVTANDYYYTTEPYKIIQEPVIYESLTIDFSTSGKSYLLIDDYPIEYGYGIESTSFIFDNEDIFEKIVFSLTDSVADYHNRTISFDGDTQIIVRKV